MTSRTPCSRWRWAGLVFLIGLFSALGLPMQLQAQPSNEDLESSAGTTYVIAYPDTTMNTFDARYPNLRHPDNAYMYIYSAVDNRVTIRGAGFNKTELLQAGKFTIVNLMDATAKAGQPIVTLSNQVNQATFRLEADQPILVYCYLLTRFGTEAWTPIPVESWGTEYYVAARPGEVANDVSPGGEFDYNKKSKMAPAEITIVAAYDDTRVSITPNGALLNFPRIANVVLQANEVYQVQSYVDTSVFADLQPDLGGSYVFATKPIGVISGNTRSQVLYFQEGLGQNIFKNMLIEWLAPVEQHGTEFVYMPTWDTRRPTGTPGEDLSSKRKGEHVRIYATRKGVTKGYSLDNNIGRTDFTIARDGRFREDFIGTPEARYYKTDKPAQAMMNSTAIVKYNGTTQGFGGYIGAQFDGYGAYMVEMVPREQWSDFTPYYASNQPQGMEHFINVVTDTAHQFDVFQENGSRFSFNRGVINGTNLVWGTMAVTTARDHHLEGRNGAKFYGFVYGIYKGHEEYRPGSTKKEKEDGEIQAARNGGGDPELLHPSEYEEYLAVAYGYPLAPSRQVVGPGDSLEIKTKMECEQMTIDIRALNTNPVGLKTIRLDSANNARFFSITPQPITGAQKATIIVAPIRADRDASAIVVIKDRTGKITRIRYTYFAERVDVDPANLLRQFGTVSPGSSATRDITFTNPLDKTITVTEAKLLDGNQDFTIVSTTPGPLPVQLTRGQSITVTVRVTPSRENRTYVDSLSMKFGCTKVVVAVIAQTSAPRIEVDDLNFGFLGVGQARTLKMKICNIGSGILEFRAGGPGAEFLEWLKKQEFKVAQSEIDRLAAAKLVGPDGAASCMEIEVTFMSDVVGRFVDSAQVFANTRDRKDFSIWTANVSQPGPRITSFDWDKQWVVTPLACGTKNTATRYDATVDISNEGTSDSRVVSLTIVGADKDFFFLDNTNTNTTVSAGDVLSTTVIRQQAVYFTPAEERDYRAQIQLATIDPLTNRADTVLGQLTGTGIETHVSVDNHYFGSHELLAGLSVPGTLTITAPPSRDLTITDLTITGANAASFRIIYGAGETAPTVASPLVIPNGTTKVINFVFEPTATGNDTAQFVITADNETCVSDWIGELTGSTYSNATQTSNAIFGSRLSCFNNVDSVFITNTGSAPLEVRSVTGVDGSGNAFLFAPTGTVPRILQPGDTLWTVVTFTRATLGQGNYTGQVVYDVATVATPEAPSRPFTVRNSDVSGDSRLLRVNAEIAKDYRTFPGKDLVIPVTLKDELDEAQVDMFRMFVTFNTGMMNFKNLEYNGTIINQNDWTVTEEKKDNATNPTGEIVYLFTAKPGVTLRSTGDLVQMRFTTFIGDTTTGPLGLNISLQNRLCADVDETPGSAAIDSVCGLDFRLIEAFSGAKYSLSQNNPNPVKDRTEINFSLGLDGNTTLVVYNAEGEKVATLVSGYLKPAAYTVTWDATGSPSGLYYYRLNSGDWTSTGSMIIAK